MIGKSTLAGIVNGLARYGTRLIMVPVVIGHLGLAGYGIWSIIMTTASYMRFGSAGIRSAFQKYVAEATGSGDFQTASKLVSTGSITMLVFSAIGLMPVALFSPKLAEEIGVPSQFIGQTAASMTVLACIYILCNFGAAFEAIVMGGHRIDVLRQFNTILQIGEAIMICMVLQCGYGLFAMTLVMGASELIYFFFCWIVSHQVLPEMRISMTRFTGTAFPELVRFAGSYQLLNLLELLYGAILPIAVLIMFGAGAAGVFAVSVRAVGAALIAQEALVLPILSAGTMVFSSGSAERVKLFLAKSFKATAAAALPPLGFVCAFCMPLLAAWTGEADPRFRIALWFAAIAGLLSTFSILQSLLYRASGKALLDNVRQLLRIVIVFVVACFGSTIGFTGLLAGMAGAEMVGVIVMYFAVATTFPTFSPRVLARDALRIAAATAMIIGAGALAGTVPVPWAMGGRLTAMTKLAQIALGCLIAVWPVLIFTKPISSAERRTLLDTLMPGRRGALALSE